jgi:pimeloyl-ACP methyl ester carboxylesterase
VTSTKWSMGTPPRNWLTVVISALRLGGEVAKQAAAKRMGPALVVSPQMDIPAGVDTECVNGAGGNPQLEIWLAQDVPNWVARTFRVQTDQAAWATIGLSAGGWCAAMVAMLHPAQFAAAIVLGGYFRPSLAPSTIRIRLTASTPVAMTWSPCPERTRHRWPSGWRLPTRTLSPTARVRHSSRRQSHHWPWMPLFCRMPDTGSPCGKVSFLAAWPG